MTIRIDGTNTAANPGITGSDTDTGLQFGTDEVNIVTGGSTRATVDSSGRLLVGTSTASSAGDAQISRLEIAGNTSNAQGAALVTLKNGTAAASLASNSILGRLVFAGLDGNDFAYIDSRVDATPGSNDYPGRLVFSTTADGASSPTERMRICSTSSNSDVLYLNCTGRTNSAPNTTGGRIWQTNGNCKIRTADTSAAFQFYSATGGTSSAVGSIVVNASSTSYNTSSDYRLKENVVDLDGAITRVKQLAPKRFNFIADEADTTVDGFLAHEAQTVVPEAVTGTHNEVDDDGNPVMQGIDQSKLVPLLTAALQEAIAKIESLETRVAQLEGGTN